MLSHKEILNTFEEYDHFLFSQKNNTHYGAFQSLKMMYSLHINIAIQKSHFFVAKQLLRLIFKLLLLPIKTMKLIGLSRSCSILQTVPHLDIQLSRDHNVGLMELQSIFGLNTHTLTILKEWLFTSKIILQSPYLHISHTLALLHRLLDYFITYHTVEFTSIKMLLMENDRFPTSKALIDKARIVGIHTVKFDYWLLDPIHHNDIYCDTYFCPNDYHKTIASNIPANKHINIIKGGFPNWDHLNNLPIEKAIDPFIVYFTQPTVPFNDHKRHINDLRKHAPNYKIIIKVHPRENTSLYTPFVMTNIDVIGQEIDSYTLLAQGSMFFSVFSTISLEAKHISPYSFFIHYTDSDYKSPIDYIQMGLDVITDTSMLKALFNNELFPVSKESFIASSNPSYPHSTNKLLGLCHP